MRLHCGLRLFWWTVIPFNCVIRVKQDKKQTVLYETRIDSVEQIARLCNKETHCLKNLVMYTTVFAASCQILGSVCRKISYFAKERRFFETIQDWLFSEATTGITENKNSLHQASNDLRYLMKESSQRMTLWSRHKLTSMKNMTVRPHVTQNTLAHCWLSAKKNHH